MPWAVAGGALAAGGSLAAGAMQSDANDKAAKQAMTNYNYLTGGPLGTQYLPTGGQANQAQAQLLGLGGVDTGATYDSVLNALKQNVGSGYDQKLVAQVEQMKVSGAPIGALKNVLDSWAS